MANVIFFPTIQDTVTDEATLATHPIYGIRPRLRGRFHQVGAVLSVPIGVYLVVAVAGPQSRGAAAAYAVTWSLMFTTSAAYHRVADGVVARFWMRRLDHSMILIHIAGATTPIALLAVGGRAGLALLVVTWLVAVTGTVVKMTTLTADQDPCPWVFPLLGWLPLLAVPTLSARFGWETAMLLLAAVVTYAGGAFCFARKSPDPVPTIFGYHEVWHVFTLLAGGFQMLLIARLIAA